jgi:hypothetical protein
MMKIADASKKGEVNEIARLNALAKRAQDIQRTIITLDNELNAIQTAADTAGLPNGAGLPCPSDGHSTSAHATAADHKLRVTIDWPALGVPRPLADISDEHPTHTLLMFIKELYAAYGDDALKRLSTLRVSRGPLVSLSPKTDYRNPRRGTLYSHYHFQDTPYYILTHSSTSEKAQIIQDAAKHLGLDATRVRVDLQE